MEGGTTFHFLDATPAKALQVALEAAPGQDVRIGGRPTVAREFIAAGLVDYIYIVQTPVLFGRGVRLWDGLEGMEKDYGVEAVTSPSGVTHFVLERLPLGAGTGGGEEEDDAPRSPWHAPKGDTE